MGKTELAHSPTRSFTMGSFVFLFLTGHRLRKGMPLSFKGLPPGKVRVGIPRVYFLPGSPCRA